MLLKKTAVHNFVKAVLFTANTLLIVLRSL